MTDTEFRIIARAEAFHAVTVEPAAIRVNPAFRAYCEENRCGNYGANYSCPPDCGTPEELRRLIPEQKRIIVIQTVWSIDGSRSSLATEQAKFSHNKIMIDLADGMRAEGNDCSALGCGGCTLCRPCMRRLNRPCSFPEKRISCISAYCIDVSELAARCGLEISWSNDTLYLFGMLLIP